MNIRTRLAVVMGALVLAAGTGGSLTAAVASPSVLGITGVSFSGTLAAPTVTVTGTGFGKAPTNGLAVSALTNCQGQNGLDFPGGKLWLVDANSGEPWTAGSRVGTNGNCVGVNIVSWSAKQVVFTFGNGYGTNGWNFNDNDPIVVSLRTSPFVTFIPGGF